MRFFEFKLPEPGTDLAKQVDAELKDIVDIVDQNPAAEKKVNVKLQAILDFVKKSAPDQKSPISNVNPPPEETKEELFSESTATLSLVDALYAQINSSMEKATSRAALKMIADLKKTITQEFAAERQAGKDIRDVEIQNFFSGLEEQLRALAAKAAPNPNILKEIVIRFKSSFSDAILRDRKFTQEDFKDFLNDALSGKVIDMSSLVKSDKGNVNNFVTDPKHKLIFDIIKDDVFGYKPGGTGANMGPGEVALTMFGNPIRKGEIGDLDIDGIMYEVKGGQTTGKESGYGGRMNGKQVQKPTSGFVLINNFFKKYLPTVDPIAIGPTGKKGSRFNWNTKGLNALNDVMITNVKKKDKRSILLKELMFTLWSGLINNRDEIKNFQERVYSMITDDGIVDIGKAIQTAAELLYESYALSDGQMIKGKPIFNIIVLNAGNLNYQIIRSSKDISKVRIVGGISWNDANQSTSPQLFMP